MLTVAFSQRRLKVAAEITQKEQVDRMMISQPLCAEEIQMVQCVDGGLRRETEETRGGEMQ